MNPQPRTSPKPRFTRASLRRMARNRQGFTLVELLVASAIASIVILAVFAFFYSMSNIFYTQNQTVDARSNMRFSLDMISRETKRAGHLGTPSVNNDPLICPKVNNGLRFNGAGMGGDLPAVHVQNGDGRLPFAGPGNRGIVADGEVFNFGTGAQQNFVRPDTLTIVGSFEISQAFELEPIQASNNVEIDFVDASVNAILGDSAPALFPQVFRTGRLIRLAGPDGNAQIVRIEGIADLASYRLRTTPMTFREGNVGCGIEGSAGEGYQASLLNIYRYQVVQNAQALAKMDLVRSELNADTWLPFYTVPVLEYVVDFQVWFDCAQQGANGPNIAVDNRLGDYEGNRNSPGCGGVDDSFQQARVAHIEVSARTPREDRTLSHVPRLTESGPLLTFNTNQNNSDAARVVTLTTQVELTNLTLRNVD